MNKIFNMITLILICCCLTGCLSMEQREEKRNIEKETTDFMINYLKDNYGIKKVSNVNAKYSMHGDIAESEFENVVTGTFEKGGKEYFILYDYTTEKCYDSFSYINKINPIITDYIESLLNKNSTSNIIKPDYAIISDGLGYSYYLTDGVYGLYNNSDNVKTFNDIRDYYDIKSLEIIYNSSNTIIENNINLFENLYNELGLSIHINVYNNGIEKEYLNGSPKSQYDSGGHKYHLNEIQSIGNFNAYWTINEISTYDPTASTQYKFELSIVKNNSDFDEKIELYGTEYNLYSQDILMVKDISNNNDHFNHIYLKLNKKVCDKLSKIVYNDDYYGLREVSSTSVSFESGLYQTKKFAIYCQQ